MILIKITIFICSKKDNYYKVCVFLNFVHSLKKHFKMKYNSIFLSFSIFLGLFLFSCNSSDKKENQKENTEKTTNLQAQEIEKTVQTTDLEQTVVENNSELDKYKAEIALINEKIMEINNDISNFSIKNADTELEKTAYKVKNFYNKETVLIKSELTSNMDSWTLYYTILSGKDTKLMYSKFVGQLDENTGKPTVREFFSIGSLIKGNETFALILDENEKQIMGQELMKYQTLYDNVFIATAELE